MFKPVLIAVCIAAFPATTYAAININEIAWMGDSASANNEWIELHNDGNSAINVDGWTLTDNANLTISLSGTIPAGAYPVLERTDDNSAPGTAFLIYTGALSNSGATLTLTDASGAVMDQVVGGTAWQNIGGDNTTKETAQFTPSGWVTGPPTPGAANVSASSAADTNTSSAATQTMVLNEHTDTAVTLVTDPPPLTVAISGPEQSTVDLPVSFVASSDGPVKMVRQSVVYTWNFGDFSTATGTSVTHRYRYPGTYEMTLYGAYHDLYTASAKQTITVLPVRLSLTYSQDGLLQINNDAPYEVDLSGYSLVAGESFRFPARTIVLPRATLTVPPERIDASAATVRLYDANGVLVATTSTVTQSDSPPASQQPALAPIVSTAPPPVTPAVPSFAFPAKATSAVPTPPAAHTAVVTKPPANGLAAVLPSSGSGTDSALPAYLAFGGVVGLALLGVYAGRPRK